MEDSVAAAPHAAPVVRGTGGCGLGRIGRARKVREFPPMGRAEGLFVLAAAVLAIYAGAELGEPVLAGLGFAGLAGLGILAVFAPGPDDFLSAIFSGVILAYVILACAVLAAVLLAG